MRQFAYLGRLQSSPNLFAVSTKTPYKTAADLKGKAITVSTGTQIFNAAMVCKELGITCNMVVYDSGPESVMAAMRGDTEAVFIGITATRGIDTSGKLVNILQTLPDRAPEYPDIPSAKEVGLTLPQSVLSMEVLVVAPPKMDTALKAKLEKIVADALADPEFAQAMKKAGQFTTIGSAAQITENMTKMYETLNAQKDVLAPLLKK